MEREISHTPAHWQPSRSWVEQAAPRLAHPEDMAKLQMEGEAACLPPGWDVKRLLRQLQPGTVG